jgi:hypothetical protein
MQTRQKLTRMQTPWADDERHYSHPHGWRIIRYERDWNYGAGAIGATGFIPKVWWEVWPLTTPPSKRRTGFATFDARTLRECRAWCDDNPRWGA